MTILKKGVSVTVQYVFSYQKVVETGTRRDKTSGVLLIFSVRWNQEGQNKWSTVDIFSKVLFMM
jgi:hypothetical protein